MKTAMKIILFTILTYSISACSSHEEGCAPCNANQIQVNPYSSYNYTQPQPYQNVW